MIMIRTVNLASHSMTGSRNKLGTCALTFGLATLAVLPLLGQPNAITTVAGGGSYPISDYGDGGPATSAVLGGPSGVVVDRAGNIYIADPGTERIRKVNTAGIISTVAGAAVNGVPGSGFFGDGGPATSALFDNPVSVAVDSAGNIYIADSGNNRIRKVDTAGIINTVAGNGKYGFAGDGGPATSAELLYPGGVAVDRAGNIYIADHGNNRIRKVDTAGIITTVAGGTKVCQEPYCFSGDGGPATSAQLAQPSGVAVDSAGNIYIADTFNNRIRKVDTFGIINTIAGNGYFNMDGYPNGYGGFSGDLGLATSAALNEPLGVAVDSAGNLYIADTNNQRIRMVNTSGIIYTVAGNGNNGFTGDGGPATSAELNAPGSVAGELGPGNIFIADSANARIRLVTVGTVTTLETPAVNEMGVVNNASFAVGSNPVAPGSIAAIFGTNLNDSSTVLFSSFGPDGNLVTMLADAQVTINGEAAPLFYSTLSQLGIQIPTDLTGTSATIEVTVGFVDDEALLTSGPMTISLDTFAPGIFTFNQTGKGQGAILIANTNTLAAPTGSDPFGNARPAIPGEFITIFCTGLGPVTPALPTGVPATSNMTVAAPTVTIDGVSGVVEFSGMAPGFVGLNQVNVQVPFGTRSADDIPVVLTIGGKQSNTVTMAVAAP